MITFCRRSLPAAPGPSAGASLRRGSCIASVTPASQVALAIRFGVADQIARWPGTLLPIEVRYDEYSVDTAENRILRSALRRMLDVPRVPVATAARLRHLDARLDGVTPLLPGVGLPQWRPTRLNARYHAALRLAELVLRHQSFEVGPGGLPIAAFVVDMATVFENFVGTALREAWAVHPGETWPG